MTEVGREVGREGSYLWADCCRLELNRVLPSSRWNLSSHLDRSGREREMKRTERKRAANLRRLYDNQAICDRSSSKAPIDPASLPRQVHKSSGVGSLAKNAPNKKFQTGCVVSVSDV